MSRLAADTTVHPLARPIHVGSGEDAALLLHGWTGWAGRLTYLAGRLADAGLTVDVPRLPGHGTTLDDFLTTDADDWYRRALDAYLDLSSTHRTVYVAGTSMGAVMAVILATQVNFVPAAEIIFIAMLFDFLDGQIARIYRATSRFGLEFDALADLVSFGVAPGL